MCKKEREQKSKATHTVCC